MLESLSVVVLVFAVVAYLARHLTSLTERRSQLALVRWSHAEGAFWRELARARVEEARAALDRARVIASEAETVAHIRAGSADPGRVVFFWREVRIREMEDALAEAQQGAQAWKA